MPPDRAACLSVLAEIGAIVACAAFTGAAFVVGFLAETAEKRLHAPSESEADGTSL